MNEKYKMAVLFSCFNRKESSIRCVKSLINSASKVNELDITFYVWDDGSTDGTPGELKLLSDRINVHIGPGQYYWSKSMNAIMREAVIGDYDLYLMVNDDVAFCEDALETLYGDYKVSGGKCGIVGSMKYEGQYTYGGRDRDYYGIIPDGQLNRCYYSNWNCFLIDRYVVEKVGLICGKYKHAGGDFDYSCRMNRKGIPQFIASKYVGECEIDHAVPQYLNPKLKVSERMKALFSVKGEPIGSFYRFHWVDKRVKGIIIATYSYILLIIKVILLR